MRGRLKPVHRMVNFSLNNSKSSHEWAERVVEEVRQSDEAYNRAAESAATADAESGTMHRSDSGDVLGPSGRILIATWRFSLVSVAR